MSSNCIWTIVILYYDCVWIEQIVFDCELCSRSYKYEICYFVLLVWLSVLSQVARWLYWPKWPDRHNWPDWHNWPTGMPFLLTGKSLYANSGNAKSLHANGRNAFLPHAFLPTCLFSNCPITDQPKLVQETRYKFLYQFGLK